MTTFDLVVPRIILPLGLGKWAFSKCRGIVVLTSANRITMGRGEWATAFLYFFFVFLAVKNRSFSPGSLTTVILAY